MDNDVAPERGLSSSMGLYSHEGAGMPAQLPAPSLARWTGEGRFRKGCEAQFAPWGHKRPQ